MADESPSWIRRILLWEYHRGSWQYDVIVALILAFIFLTPRDWFRDQPRIPNASSVAMLPGENGSAAFFVDAELLRDVPEDQQLEKLSQILTARTGKRQTVTRVQPIDDEIEQETKGYMAFTKP
jgi:hypothetical protein